MTDYTCPICYKYYIDKVYSTYISSTHWSDNCRCCDEAYCMYHLYHTDDLPIRPSDEEMTRRAEEKMERWKKADTLFIEACNKQLETIKKQAYLEGYNDALKGDEPKYELEDY